MSLFQSNKQAQTPVAIISQPAANQSNQIVTLNMYRKLNKQNKLNTQPSLQQHPIKSNSYINLPKSYPTHKIN